MGSAVGAGARILERIVGSGADDAARLAGRASGGIGRTAGRVAGTGAAVGVGAFALGGLGDTLSNMLRGASAVPGQRPGGSMVTAEGDPTMMGRPGLTSVRSFAPPANDNTPHEVTFNAHGDIPLEQLKVQAAAANSLASIEATVKNILQFQTAKAQYEARAQREISLEASNASALQADGSPGGQTSEARENRGGLGGLGIAAAIAGGFALLASRLPGFGRPEAGSGDPGSPNISPPSGIGQTIGDAAFAAERGGVAAARMAQTAGSRIAGATIGAATSAASSVRGASGVGQIVAANDNIRLAKSLKVLRFFRSLRASPIGRFPWVSTIFAGIDPTLALIESGGTMTPNVERQLIGAIAQLLGGVGGVAVGAAVGGAVGSVVPGLGTIVGIISGGLLGAAAALGSEFIAEKLFDLVIGEITGQQFVNIITSAAVTGARRLPGMAIGAGLGLVAAAVGGARVVAAAAPRAVPAAVHAISGAAPAAARAASGGLRFAAPTVRSTVAATGAVAGFGALAATQPRVSGGALPANDNNLNGEELLAQAQSIVSRYAGRVLTPSEWLALIKAVHGESGAGGGGREDAMIAATILNRARNPGAHGANAGEISRNFLRQGLNVLAVLFAPNQFQAVTGTRANNHRPSANYANGPSHRRLQQILRALVTYLPRVTLAQTAFTAAATAAYGAGTNINYRTQLLNAGGSVVGGTVFNGTIASAPVISPTTTQPRASAAAPQRAANDNSPIGSSSAGKPQSEATGVTANSAPTAGNSPWVLPVSGVVTSRYRTENRPGHNGVDIGIPVGTPIQSASAGVVETVAFERAGAGKYVKIRHGDGKRSLYMHLSRQDVAVGDQVQAGQVIGRSGNTGSSTGPHLHFEIRRPPGGRGTSINPATIFPALRTAARTVAGAVAPALAAAGASATSLAASASHGHDHGSSPSAGSTTSSSEEGGSIFSRLAAAFSNFGRPSDPAVRAAEIEASTTAVERARNVVTVQQTRPSKDPVVMARSRQEKTDSGAPESVSSPVMSAYAYASYWGVAA